VNQEIRQKNAELEQGKTGARQQEDPAMRSKGKHTTETKNNSLYFLEQPEIARVRAASKKHKHLANFLCQQAPKEGTQNLGDKCSSSHKSSGESLPSDLQHCMDSFDEKARRIMQQEDEERDPEKAKVFARRLSDLAEQRESYLAGIYSRYPRALAEWCASGDSEDDSDDDKRYVSHFSARQKARKMVAQGSPKKQERGTRATRTQTWKSPTYIENERTKRTSVHKEEEGP
jgi:hypothetical protein